MLCSVFKCSALRSLYSALNVIPLQYTSIAWYTFQYLPTKTLSSSQLLFAILYVNFAYVDEFVHQRQMLRREWDLTVVGQTLIRGAVCEATSWATYSTWALSGISLSQIFWRSRFHLCIYATLLLRCGETCVSLSIRTSVLISIDSFPHSCIYGPPSKSPTRRSSSPTYDARTGWLRQLALTRRPPRCLWCTLDTGRFRHANRSLPGNQYFGATHICRIDK